MPLPDLNALSSPAWEGHSAPTTVDRSDRKFLELCRSIYSAWANEVRDQGLRSRGLTLAALHNEQRVTICLASPVLWEILKSSELETYFLDLVRIFGESIVVRILSKHIYLE